MRRTAPADACGNGGHQSSTEFLEIDDVVPVEDGQVYDEAGETLQLLEVR